MAAAQALVQVLNSTFFVDFDTFVHAVALGQPPQEVPGQGIKLIADDTGVRYSAGQADGIITFGSANIDD